MKEILTEIEIDAPPETVWALLADIESYEAWNPHITHASGDLREGGSLEITVERIDVSPRTMSVRVSEIDPPERLQWVGTVGSKWVFQGHHTFELRPLPGDRTRLINHERVTGILVPFAVSDEPQRDYDRMNRALKQEVEDRLRSNPVTRITPPRDH